MMSAAKVNRSNQFRDFLKYLQKARTYNRKQPDLKKLLGCKEYKENEKFKIVQCEMNLQVVRVNRSD